MVRTTATAAIAAFVLIGVVTYGLAAEAQIYKWVDEKGTIHFSDDPPAPSEAIQPAQVMPKEPAEAMVKNAAPPPSSESEPEGDEEEPYEPDLSALEEGLEGDEEPSSVVVVEGDLDPAVRYRALSPRNRPGQPIRPIAPRGHRRRR